MPAVRGPAVQFTLDGERFEAFAGETVAAALWAAGRRAVRSSAKVADRRGLYCGMGVCFECLVVRDGETLRSCMLLVEDGMQLRSWPDR